MDSSLPPVSPSAGPPPLYVPPRGPTSRPRPNRGWTIAALILGVLLILSVLGHLLGALTGFGTPSRQSGPRLQESLVEDNSAADKIALIPVEGVIAGGAVGGGYDLVSHIKEQLKSAQEDDRVRAVILKVNSPGGEVLASDDIAREIQKFQKNSGKPVVACMSSLAASGGYYVSAPCRWIVANELTITGSIGVIMHGYNYRGLMNKVGLAPMVFKSGRFKDMLSGEKDLDQMSPQEKEDFAEEQRMIQKMVGETFDRFKSVVATGREEANRQNKSNTDSTGQTLSAKWADYADGRILSGKEAHSLGLVDELGNLETAVARAKKLAEIDDADLIEYQPVFDLSHFLRFFGKSEPAKIQLDLGFEPPKLRAGHLYFLSPTFVH